MSEHVLCASSAAATEIASNEGTRMSFMRACELGRILWVTFLVRARKVTRPPVRIPVLLTLILILKSSWAEKQLAIGQPLTLLIFILIKIAKKRFPIKALGNDEIKRVWE